MSDHNVFMFLFVFAKFVLLFLCPHCNHGDGMFWPSLCWWRKTTWTVLTDPFPIRPLTSSSSLLGDEDFSFPLTLLAGWPSVRPRSASSDTSRAGIGCLQKRNESYWLFDFSIVWERTWEEPETESSSTEQQVCFHVLNIILTKLVPEHRIRTFHGSVLEFIKTLHEILLLTHANL